MTIPGHGVVTQQERLLAEIEAVYRECFDRFLHVATAITGNVDSAADSVQEAFARAIRLGDGYRGSGSVEAWLWRIVVNAARGRTDSPTVQISIEETLESAPGATAPDPSRIRSLLFSLPERQRLVLFLRYYADLDYGSIAAALGVSSGTVGATLHSAHAALRAQLKEASCP